jgi:GNAT superfamily N-acetyltransferase
MKSSDAFEVVDLLSQLSYPTNPKAFQKRLKNLKSKLDLLLVAVSGKKLAGFASLHLIPLVHENGFLARITALVVDQEFRRKGVGKTLVRKLEINALKNGAVRLEVTSAARRKDAHRFYLEMGYQEYRKRFMKSLKTLK